jgi:CSLREA domain-containing protein
VSSVEAGGGRRAGLIAAALVAFVCALALPAVAAAEQFEVNSTADEPALVAGVCTTAGGKCTLRAAIEASNSSALETDTIRFDETVFEGQLADTIVLGSSLPPIESNARIEGRQCPTAAGVTGPCQGISGPSAASPALTIEDANQVEIEGLAVTGAQTGINIVDGSAEVRVRGSWFGVKLDGSADGNTTGVFIDPESNNDRIGGESEEARNIFANNSGDGLRIFGADETLVLGNYFGVKPDGVTQAANGKDIEVVSQLAGGFEATGNLIGVQSESEAATTEACDKGCNVIAGAVGSGVDLQGNSIEGESPAVETHVAGNFIGLASDGKTVIPNGVGGAEGAAGIKVGAAAKTLVGGTEEDGSEVNFFAGGSFGIYAENAEDLRVLGNTIGFALDATPITAPGTAMFLHFATSVEAATIEDNLIGMDAGGVAIEQVFRGAEIVGNSIIGGEIGILSRGTGFPGNLIAENLIEGAEGNGILLKSDANLVLGNEVVESGGAGIRVQDTGAPFAAPTTENQIGGDSEAEENGVFGSDGAAIQIIDFEETANEVGRNYGEGNSGAFIDLVGTEAGEDPNGGIKPPTFSTSTQSTASGSGAKEGAVIRVFRKASAEAGELESFLAETQADAAGNWSVAYPGQIPTGTVVAATQTSKGATSELATATSTADPVKPVTPVTPVTPDKPPVKACLFASGDCGGGPPNPPPTPQTKISKGPKAKSHSTTAEFKFSASVKGSTFQCKLDKGKFKKCKSPKQYQRLKSGKHVFKVRAINSAGVADPTPAKRKFTVLG